MQPATPGSVWLVGAGPGDPDLLTVQAARLIGQAQIVLHDALIGPGVLALIAPGARRIDVGKRAGAHTRQQAVINRMLVDAARTGCRVVRLKGGDPSVFGRASEEVAALAAAGFAARICPGITTACAAAAAATSSLTQRSTARQVTFVTAKACAADAQEPDWGALAAAGSVVVYMGRSAAGRIARAMLQAGIAATTPVLVAADVSAPTARSVHATLDTLAVTMLALPADAPTTLMIGAAFAPAPVPAPVPGATHPAVVSA